MSRLASPSMVVNFDRSVPDGKRIMRQIYFMVYKPHSSTISLLWCKAYIISVQALIFKGNLILHIVCFSENGHPGKCAFQTYSPSRAMFVVPVLTEY